MQLGKKLRHLEASCNETYPQNKQGKFHSITYCQLKQSGSSRLAQSWDNGELKACVVTKYLSIMQSIKQRFKATHMQTAALTILFCWKSMQQLPFSWAGKKFLKLTNRITKALHSMQIKCIQNDSTTVPIVLCLNAHMSSSQSIKHWYFYMGVGINSHNNFFLSIGYFFSTLGHVSVLIWIIVLEYNC